jgi:hypothetical protein
VTAKAEALNKQREEVAAVVELRELVGPAQGMLDGLCAETATFRRRVTKIVRRRRRRRFTAAQRADSAVLASTLTPRIRPN